MNTQIQTDAFVFSFRASGHGLTSQQDEILQITLATAFCDYDLFFFMGKHKRTKSRHCAPFTHNAQNTRLCASRLINRVYSWKKKKKLWSKCLTDSNIPTFNSFPKTVLSPSAEQFQRPFLNWNWHSLMPIWAPSPMTIMASGRLWQIIRCLGAKPGILLQIMLAPRATTDEKPLWTEDGHDLRDRSHRPFGCFPVSCCLAIFFFSQSFHKRLKSDSCSTFGLTDINIFFMYITYNMVEIIHSFSGLL